MLGTQFNNQGFFNNRRKCRKVYEWNFEFDEKDKIMWRCFSRKRSSIKLLYRVLPKKSIEKDGREATI